MRKMTRKTLCFGAFRTNSFDASLDLSVGVILRIILPRLGKNNFYNIPKYYLLIPCDVLKLSVCDICKFLLITLASNVAG